MATTLKIVHTDDNGESVLKLEFNAEAWIDGTHVRTLCQYVMEERRERALIFLRYKLESGVTYSYKFEVQDGSIWEQTFVFDPLEDPLFEANTGSWKLSRTVAQRPLRDLIIFMHQSLGLRDIKFDFTPA